MVALIWSAFAPIIVLTSLPPLKNLKVGIAVISHAAAVSSFSSTSICVEEGASLLREKDGEEAERGSVWDLSLRENDKKESLSPRALCLDECHVGVLLGPLDEHGCDPLARPAPRRGEVDDDEPGGAQKQKGEYTREKPAAAESESRVPTIWGGEVGGWVGSELL